MEYPFFGRGTRPAWRTDALFRAPSLARISLLAKQFLFVELLVSRLEQTVNMVHGK